MTLAAMEKQSLQQYLAGQEDTGPSDLSGEHWMALLEDSKLMSALSLPGTHDSAAYTYNLPFVTTQRMTIRQQLDAGIRYFDLRCGLRAGVLEMVHGPTFLGLRLEAVLSEMYAWLLQHALEALIVQVKKDRNDDGSTIDFGEAVMNIIAEHPKHWRLETTTPTLGEIRGRIQVFRRFRGPSVTAYGIDVSRWQDNPQRPFTMPAGREIKVTVQDHYNYVEAEPLPSLVEKKMNEVSEVLDLAKESNDLSHWFINFTSALEFNWSYRYPPRVIAEGGWFGFQRVKGINNGLHEYFEGVRSTRCGIVAMDFPECNRELILSVIKSNFPRCKKDVLGTIKLLILVIALFPSLLILYWVVLRH